MPEDTVTCSACGELIDETADTNGARAPCPNCGAVTRTAHAHVREALTLRDGIKSKAFRGGTKKAFVEDQGVPSYSHKYEKLVFHERVIDRENDRYLERVTDYQTGEVLHFHEEPLSEHRGHGSAKTKAGGNDG